MNTLSEEYILLFHKLTELADTLQSLRDEVLAAQLQAEELFISREEPV